MSTALQFDTHEIFNQSPPYEDIDLFSTDAPLVDAVKANGAGGETAALSAFGRQWGAAEMFALGRRANENPPKLYTFDPKGFRRDVVEFHPAYHELMRASIAAGLHASTMTPAGKRAAPPAEVARAARYYMAAQVESGHLCPITMTRAALAALAAEPELLAQVAPKVVARSYDPTFRPWTEKSGMTLGMGMTEKQGGTRRARQHHAPPPPVGRFLCRYRPQMVSLRADVRRLPGAGAGAGRAHLLLRAALPSRRLGQRAAAAAPQGQARQPLQCVERSRVRRGFRLARRRRRRRRAHHHPDGAADAARLRARLVGLHAHGADAGGAPQPLPHRVPKAPLRPADDARGAGRSRARGGRRGGACHAACSRVRPRREKTRARPPMRAWSRRRQSTGSARPRQASSTRPWSASAATAMSRKACCRGSIARRRSTRSGKGSGNVMCLDVLRALRRDEEAAELFASLTREASRLSGAMEAPFDRENAIASEAAAREMVGRLAGTAAAAALNDSAPAAVAEAFVRARVVRPRGALYGADGLEAATAELLLERALPGA